MTSVIDLHSTTLSSYKANTLPFFTRKPQTLEDNLDILFSSSLAQILQDLLLCQLFLI